MIDNAINYKYKSNQVVLFFGQEAFKRVPFKVGDRIKVIPKADKDIIILEKTEDKLWNKIRKTVNGIVLTVRARQAEKAGFIYPEKKITVVDSQYQVDMVTGQVYVFYEPETKDFENWEEFTEGDTKIPNSEVYETKEYNKFKLPKGKVPARSVKKLVESFTKDSYRITPMKINKDYEICDGVATIEACIELGIPVPYTLYSDLTAQKALKYNTIRKQQKTDEVAHAYAVLPEHKKTYAKLMQIYDEYYKEGVTVPLSTLVALLSHNTPSYTKKIRLQFLDGKFQINHARETRNFIRFFDAFEDYMEKQQLYSRSFMIAVKQLETLDNYKRANLLGNLKSKGRKLSGNTTAKEYLGALIEIHNYHLRGDRVKKPRGIL